MQIHHGAVTIQNVVLSDPPDHPRRENFTAKLTDFSNAKLGFDDNRVLATDIRAYGVFASNLFVEDSFSVVRFDKANLEFEQEIIRTNLEPISRDHPDLVVLLMKLVVPEPVGLAQPTAKEINVRFSKLHELLRSSVEKFYAERAVHPTGYQALSQPLHSAEVEVQSVLRL